MSDTVREIFVKNLRYFMEAKGISQADICRELNVSSATVSDWCNGKKHPRVDKMQRLAELLGVRFSSLTSESGVKDFEDQQRLELLHQKPQICTLIDVSRDLPEEDVDFMIQYAERIRRQLDLPEIKKDTVVSAG